MLSEPQACHALFKEEVLSDLLSDSEVPVTGSLMSLTAQITDESSWLLATMRNGA